MFLGCARDDGVPRVMRDSCRRTCRALYGEASNAALARSEIRILEVAAFGNLDVPDPDASFVLCVEGVAPRPSGVPPSVSIKDAGRDYKTGQRIVTVNASKSYAQRDVYLFWRIDD